MNKLVDYMILFVEVCGLSNLMYVKFSQPLQTHSFGVNPEKQDYEIWPQETRDIALSYGVEISTDYCSFFLSQCTRLTDRRTDIQTADDSKSSPLHVDAR